MFDFPLLHTFQLGISLFNQRSVYCGIGIDENWQEEVALAQKFKLIKLSNFWETIVRPFLK